MLNRSKTALVSALLLATPTTIALTAAAPADAAGKYYSSCDALHKHFKHGVAKNKRSAKKQVRAGYGKPATGKKAKAVYRTNASRLDRDKDGTACEA